MGLGLTSAIHIASMGMRASEKTINVSGDNLANANTIGYKAERADFTSFLPYIYNYGYPESTAHFNAGTNPLQIGMGVELASVTTDFTQGSFKEGMTNSDIAINGNGFLVVQQPGISTQYYTRNGALKLNSNLELTTNNGLNVMGYGVNGNFELQPGLTTLRIPINELKIAQQTHNVTIEGILNAVGDSATQGTVLRTNPLTDLSKSVPVDTGTTISQLALPQVEGTTTATGTSTATGSVPSGDYLYRFAYVDANGVESDFSSPVNATVGTTQNTISLTNLPTLPTGADYTTLRIYRAVNPNDETMTPEFLQIADLDTAATTYLDEAASGDPTKVLNQGRLNGTYQYYVTYTNGVNESRPTAVGDPISVNGGKLGGQLELSGLPTPPAGSNWTGINIYRSTGSDASKFYQIGSLSSSSADQTFIDRVPDTQLISGKEMNFAGGGNVLANNGTLLVNLGQQDASGNFVHVFEKGTLVLEPKKDNTDLREATLQITDTTTVADYLAFLNEAYGIRSTADGIPPDQGAIGSTINNGKQGATIIDGSMYLTGDPGVDNKLVLSGSSMYMITAADPHKGVNLPWTEVQAANGESTATDLQVFDSLGAGISVRMTLVLESKSNTETVYRWYADSPDNQPSTGVSIATGSGTLTFGQDGKLLKASNTTITVERTEVASVSPTTFEFEMNIGALMALATNEPEVTQTDQDGAGAGILQDYAIQSDGTILGIFSSDAVRTIGKIPLATFANQEGLYKVGESLYRVSANSGDALIPDLTGNNLAKIKANTLELSNTDIGTEIINMVLASAMYRANSKVITTSNELFDSLLRMV